MNGAALARFAHPEWAPALALAALAIAALVLVSFAAARRRAARLLGAARPDAKATLVRDLALLAALAAIAIAALGPRIGERTVHIPSEGVDVVLLVDVSWSMAARDVPPSRLVRARAIARDLLERLAPGDRAALAAFAGRGVLLTPLTPDAAALAELLDGLDPELMSAGGSALASGIAAAVEAFEAASERPRVVVVLADGEDPARDAPADPAAPARRARARIVAVALGSEAGAAVPGPTGPLRDATGRPAVSARDAERLGRIAAATGGAAFLADRWGAVDGAALLAAVRRDAGRVPGEPTARRVPAIRTVPFAAAAFALLWLEWGAAGAGRRRPVWAPEARARPVGRRGAGAERPGPGPGAAQPPRRRWGRRAADALAPLALLGAPGALALAAALALGAPAAGGDAPARAVAPDPRALEAQLRSRPGDDALRIALGVARAERGQTEAAERVLRGVAVGARERRLAALAWYDLGVLAIGERELERARDAFLEALALDPEDEAARFNLEWTLRALASEPPPPPPGASEPGDEPAETGPSPGQPDADAAGEDAEAAPRPVPAPEADARFAPQLSPEEVERWLDAVEDGAAAGLRRAAESAEDEAPRLRSRSPAW